MANRKPSTMPGIRAPARSRTSPTGKARPAPSPTPVSDTALAEIMQRFERANPDPRGELEHTDPYTLLVAVVLSAQATDRSVNLATAELYKVARTPEQMVELGEERLTAFIRKIGLFRTKARNVIELSRRLLAEHGGVVPPARSVLESLPGVGRKTASVVLNVAFGEPTIAVDTHVFRVSHRIPIVTGRTPEEVQMRLEARIPARYLAHAHHWLILHGRYVCKARTPACPTCVVRDLCSYPAKTPPAVEDAGQRPQG